MGRLLPLGIWGAHHDDHVPHATRSLIDDNTVSTITYFWRSGILETLAAPWRRAGTATTGRTTARTLRSRRLACSCCPTSRTRPAQTRLRQCRWKENGKKKQSSLLDGRLDMAKLVKKPKNRPFTSSYRKSVFDRSHIRAREISARSSQAIIGCASISHELVRDTRSTNEQRTLSDHFFPRNPCANDFLRTVNVALSFCSGYSNING